MPTVHSCQDISSIHEVVIKNVSLVIEEIPEEHEGTAVERHEIEYDGCVAEFEVTLEYSEAMPIFSTSHRPLRWRVPIKEELVFPFQRGD